MLKKPFISIIKIALLILNCNYGSNFHNECMLENIPVTELYSILLEENNCCDSHHAEPSKILSLMPNHLVKRHAFQSQ